MVKTIPVVRDILAIRAGWREVMVFVSWVGFGRDVSIEQWEDYMDWMGDSALQGRLTRPPESIRGTRLIQQGRGKWAQVRGMPRALQFFLGFGARRSIPIGGVEAFLENATLIRSDLIRIMPAVAADPMKFLLIPVVVAAPIAVSVARDLAQLGRGIATAVVSTAQAASQAVQDAFDGFIRWVTGATEEAAARGEREVTEAVRRARDQARRDPRLPFKPGPGKIEEAVEEVLETAEEVIMATKPPEIRDTRPSQQAAVRSLLAGLKTFATGARALSKDLEDLFGRVR